MLLGAIAMKSNIAPKDCQNSVMRNTED
jgi:hypothetical protein